MLILFSTGKSIKSVDFGHKFRATNSLNTHKGSSRNEASVQPNSQRENLGERKPELFRFHSAAFQSGNFARNLGCKVWTPSSGRCGRKAEERRKKKKEWSVWIYPQFTVRDYRFKLIFFFAFHMDLTAFQVQPTQWGRGPKLWICRLNFHTTLCIACAGLAETLSVSK